MPLTLAEQIELACLMEATARKPGNVHPGARFEDLCYDDFVNAAACLGPSLERSRHQRRSLGETILQAVEATRGVTASNANLGIILLLAPLTSVAEGTPLHVGVRDVLRSTTVRDAENVYEAIRLAMPGGLGRVKDQDVSGKPTLTLRDVMELAAGRDTIAKQYVTDFDTVQMVASGMLGMSLGFQLLEQERPTWPLRHTQGPDVPLWEAVVIHQACDLMAREPDTLIARKCGREVASEAAERASRLKAHGWPFDKVGWMAHDELDIWLRADGHRRNPGTTADLIAACLFWAIREGYIQPPTKAEVLEHARQIAATSV